MPHQGVKNECKLLGVSVAALMQILLAIWACNCDRIHAGPTCQTSI